MKMSRLVTAAALVVSLSGCALGFGSPTQNQKVTTDGVNVNAGAILVRDALLVVDPAHPQTAALTATLVNTGAQDETLESVAGTGDLKGAAFKAITIKAGQSVQIGFNSDTAVAFYTTGTIKVSTYVPVTLNFANAAAAQLSLLVNPNTDLFANVTIPVVTDGALPGAAPTQSPSASPSPSASDTAAASPSPSAS
jgi:copper(I)-binding protein